MKGRKPNKTEQKWMDAIVNIGCIVCHNNGIPDCPAEAHHLDGKTKEGAHYHILPLCPNHHRIQSPEGFWVSRHGNGRTEFEAEYGNEKELYLQAVEMLTEAGYEQG